MSTEKISVLTPEMQQELDDFIASSAFKKEMLEEEKPKVKIHLTTREVSDLLRVRPDAIHRYAKSGKLPRIKVGLKCLYRFSDVRKLLGENERG